MYQFSAPNVPNNRQNTEVSERTVNSSGRRTVLGSRNEHSRVRDNSSCFLSYSQTLHKGAVSRASTGTRGGQKAVSRTGQQKGAGVTDQQQSIKLFVKKMKDKEGNDDRNVNSVKSTMSLRSKAESRMSSHSQIEPNEMPSIQSYEKKINELILLKIAKRRQRSNVLNLTHYQDELEKQLRSMIDQIKSLHTNHSNPNCQVDAANQTEEELKEINSKILMYEKLIAESWSESQMLKKWYFAKSSVRNSRMQSANLINSQKLNFFRNMVPTGVANFPKSICNQTTNQAYYKKPCEQAYRQAENPKKLYIQNRQNLPRSSYQSQFMNYGATVPYPEPSGGCVMGVSCVSENRKSSYQIDFKQQKVHRIDTGSLDCKRDKFKMTNISFMERCNQTRFQPAGRARTSRKKVTDSRNTHTGTRKTCYSIREGHSDRENVQPTRVSNVKSVQSSKEPQSQKKLESSRKGQNKKVMQHSILMNSYTQNYPKNSLQGEKQSKYTGEKLKIQNHRKDRNLINLKSCYKNMLYV